MQQFLDIINEGEYEHFGIRAHRGDAPVVGASLANSRVWVDGECTDEEINGVCATRVTAATLEAIVARAKAEYAWGGEPIVLVGGDYVEHGYDDGEIIIRKNVCLAVL